MKITRKKQKLSKKLLPIIIISAVAVLALGYFGYAYTTKNVWPFAVQTTDSTTKPEGGINYDPPTAQELENSQEAKENNTQRAQSNTEDVEPSNASNITPISVGIAYASYDATKDVIDIRAFTPDVIEGTGICTAKLTLNGSTVTEESKGFIDFSSSQCEPILIKRTDFTATGKWSLVVSYDSPTSSGKSPAMEVEITNE